MTDKKNRAPRFTASEIDEMCVFVSNNKNKLFGTSCHSSSQIEKKKLMYWNLLAQNLSSLGVAKRDGAIVRKKWQDLSCESRRYNLQKTKTGKPFPRMYSSPLVCAYDALRKPQEIFSAL